jgi:hypothetical protein
LALWLEAKLQDKEPKRDPHSHEPHRFVPGFRSPSAHSDVDKQREHHAKRTTQERLERVEIDKSKPVETGSLQDERASSYRP